MEACYVYRCHNIIVLDDACFIIHILQEYVFTTYGREQKTLTFCNYSVIAVLMHNITIITICKEV